MNGLFLRDKPIRRKTQVVYECPSFKMVHENYGVQAEENYNLCLEQAADQNFVVRSPALILWLKRTNLMHFTANTYIRQL